MLGARNQALLGRWSTDEWQLFWAQLPFNVAVLGAFEVAGVGDYVALNALLAGMIAPLVTRHVVSIPPAVTLFALLGFENAAAPVDKVKDPKRTIPRALIGGPKLPDDAGRSLTTRVLNLTGKDIVTAPAQEPDPHRLEEPGGDELVLNGGHRLRRDHLLPLDRDALGDPAIR